MIKKSLLGIIPVFFLLSCGAKFSCPPPGEGITCTPVSKVYETYSKGIKKTETEKEDPQKPACIRPKDSYIKQTYENLPIRTPPKIVRILITPYIDEDDDFVQGTFVYTEIPTGKWILGEKIEKQEAHDFKRFREIYPAFKKDTEKGIKPETKSEIKPEIKNTGQQLEHKQDCEDGDSCSLK